MGTARVLVVENDPAAARTVQLLVEEAGHAVAAVDSCQALLDAVRADPSFNVVLLSTGVCGPDVPSVCAQLKAIPGADKISVIVVADGATDLGDPADGYLAKPIHGPALRAWIKAALRLQSLQRELSERPAEPKSDTDAIVETLALLAHAVNNPLQALYATVDMLLLTFPNEPAVVSLGKDILAHAARASRLVAQASIRANEILKASSKFINVDAAARFTKP